MEKVIKIAPAEAISLDHLGDIYFQLGRKREAYFMWTQARDLSEPEDEIIAVSPVETTELLYRTLTELR